MIDLTKKHCVSCENDIEPLTDVEVKTMLSALPGFNVNDKNTVISKEFEFKDYYQTMAFVNAIAWIAHIENHHPDLEVSYNKCIVNYTTHFINGLSENDFICAAKVNQIIPI